MKRFFLPALCAIIIVGSIYYFSNKSEEGIKELPLPSPIVEEVIKQEEPVKQVTDNQKIMNATLHTNKGDITIQFNPNTPKTVENFIKLAKSGFYDGTKFHRVIKDFMNQGGDPLSKDDSMMMRWGTGGPGYQFADEIVSGNKNDIGTLSMANAGPNTNGSQFFINTGNNNFLDTKHTVFGKVVTGMDVAIAINSVKTGEADRPVDPVVIKSISLN
jgi:peptidylprolyl isomerase